MQYTLNQYHQTVAELFTVDGVSSKDLDDAFCIISYSKNLITLQVAIADTTAHVKRGSEIDQLAEERAFSVYRGTSAVSNMLPNELSENTLSLTPGSLKSVFLLTVTLNNENKMQWLPVCVDLSKGKMENIAQLDHKIVIDILNNKDPHSNDQTFPDNVTHDIRILAKFAETLLLQRKEHGAFAIYQANANLFTDEEGRIVDFERSELALAYILVQEIMILANQQLTNLVTHFDRPILYRNHNVKLATPSAENLSSQLENALLNNDTITSNHVTQIMRQMVDPAKYGAQPSGHYGLNLPMYGHFTSPIRRYADMVNSRILNALIDNLPSPYTITELNELADIINQKYSLAKDLRSEEEKRKVNRIAKNMLLDDKKVTAAPDDVFYRMLKTQFGQNEYHATLKSELIRRLEKANLGMKALVELFFNRRLPQDDEIKHALTLFINRNIHQAPSIFTVAQTRNISIEKLNTVEDITNGKKNKFNATTSLTYHDKEYSFTVTSVSNKNQAKQMSLAGCLVKLISDTLQPTFDSDQNTQMTTNHKGLLLEYLTKSGITATPLITFKQEGLANIATFHCTIRLTLQGTEYCERASAGRKKIAEQEAARKLYNAIKTMPIPATARTSTAGGAIPSNPIGYLNELSQIGEIQNLEFTTQPSKQEQTFTCTVTCRVNGKTYRETATGIGKKAPKIEAAQQLTVALTAI